MGRIGKAIARRASGFDMKIIYYSRHRHDVDADFVSIDELLQKSDFVSVPYYPDNQINNYYSKDGDAHVGIFIKVF